MSTRPGHSSKSRNKKRWQKKNKHKSTAKTDRKPEDYQNLELVQELADLEDDPRHITHGSTPSDAGTVSTVLLDAPPPSPASPHCSQRPLPSPQKSKAYVYVPVSPSYEYLTVPDVSAPEAQLEGSRIQSQGLYATEKIEAGTRVICEPPLLLMTSEAEECERGMAIAERFVNLPPPDQSKFWGLTPASSSESPFLSFMKKSINDRLRHIFNMMRVPSAQLSESERISYRNELRKIADAATMCRLYARWIANRISLPGLADKWRSKINMVDELVGLFPEVAKLRHSCVPNCHGHFNIDKNRFAVHVIRPVEAGEELTMSAIADIYYHTADERRKKLEEQVGIRCTCEACDPKHANFNDHEKTRTAALSRAMILKHFITSADATTTGEGQALLDWAGTQEPHSELPPTIEEWQACEIICRQLTKNLQRTGCDRAPELIPWYYALIEYIQARVPDVTGELQGEAYLNSILYISEECEIIARQCFGEDSAEFEEARDRVESGRQFVDEEREYRRSDEFMEASGKNAKKKMKKANFRREYRRKGRA